MFPVLQVPGPGAGPGGAAARRPGRSALPVPQAGLPQVRQAVQLPAAAGQGGCTLHPISWGQRDNEVGANGFPDVYKVSKVKVSLGIA